MERLTWRRNSQWGFPLGLSGPPAWLTLREVQLTERPNPAELKLLSKPPHRGKAAQRSISAVSDMPSAHQHSGVGTPRADPSPGDNTGDFLKIYLCLLCSSSEQAAAWYLWQRLGVSSSYSSCAGKPHTKAPAAPASTSSLCSRGAWPKAGLNQVLSIMAWNPAKTWGAIQTTLLPSPDHFPKIQFILIKLKSINILLICSQI